MQILQLGPYPPPEGGINRNMLAIREELRARGHRCSIVATSKSTRITNEADVYHPGSALALLTLLFKLDCDVLHLHVGGDIGRRVMALVTICVAFGRGRKVLSFHSGGYPTTREGIAARKNSIRGFLFRQFDRVIAVNPTIAEVFDRYGLKEGKVCVIYPFIHRVPDERVEIPADLRVFAEQHSPFLLTVGLLEAEYDLFVQIDAMERVLDHFPDAGLMIVGSGSLEPALRQAIASKPFAKRIFLAGDVEHSVTLHLIDRCHALLRTTLFDGDAISVREALFLETPVIATDNGMRPNGVKLIPFHDEAALVNAIAALGASKRLKTQSKADDKSNIHRILTVYDEVIEAAAEPTAPAATRSQAKCQD